MLRGHYATQRTLRAEVRPSHSKGVLLLIPKCKHLDPTDFSLPISRNWKFPCVKLAGDRFERGFQFESASFQILKDTAFKKGPARLEEWGPYKCDGGDDGLLEAMH